MADYAAPIYTIHRYRDDIYKVVCFKRSQDASLCLHDRAAEQHNDSKLDCNFSRARSMVLQYALCNSWAYFFTGTIDPARFNRFSLDTYYSSLSQWIRDKRKAYGTQIQFLFVPEHHKDGAWHIHGLVQGLPEAALSLFSPPAPRKLIDGGFLNWPDYQKKFGFCSLAPIRDPVATAYYVTKYVSKDLSRRGGDLGKHLYFHSRPLNKATKASEVYLYNSELEDYCTHDHPFCKTGMVEHAKWYFPYQWDGVDSEDFYAPEPVQSMPDPLASFDAATIDPLYEQMELPL